MPDVLNARPRRHRDSRIGRAAGGNKSRKRSITLNLTIARSVVSCPSGYPGNLALISCCIRMYITLLLSSHLAKCTKLFQCIACSVQMEGMSNVPLASWKA